MNKYGLVVATLLLLGACTRQEDNQMDPAQEMPAAKEAELPLALEKVTPSSAPRFGGTELILFGQRFSEKTQVQINGVIARQVRVISPTQLIVIVPPSHILGPVPISVTHSDGSTILRTDLFAYRPANIKFGTRESSVFGNRGPLGYGVGEGSPSQVILGDINGDQKLDMIFGDAYSRPEPFNDMNRIHSQLGDGWGRIERGIGASTIDVDAHITGMALADITGDLIPDLIVASDVDDGKGITIFAGQGNLDQNFYQRFSERGLAVATPKNLIAGMATGDFNEDRYLDLALTQDIAHQVSMMLGNTAGTFSIGQSYTVGVYPVAIATADLNQDKHLDIVVANTESETISILFGNGDGTFQTAKQLSVGKNPHGLAIADINQDGWPDILVANNQSNSISVLLGKKEGLFQDQIQMDAGPLPHEIVVADFNGDFILDVAISHFRPYAHDYTDPMRIQVWLGDGVGGFSQKIPITPYGFLSSSMAVGDLDNDGKPDLVATDFWTCSYFLFLNQSN